MEARKQQWGNLSDAAREQFFWDTPGLEYSGVPDVPKGGRDEEGKVSFLMSFFHLHHLPLILLST